MNNYDRKIIEILRNEKNVKAKALAHRLDVSERSVRNYISRINAKEQIVLANRDGYYLNPMVDALREYEHETSLSVDQRQKSIAYELLKNKEGIRCYDLETRYCISEATLLKDFSYIKEILSKYDVDLYMRKGYFYLDGNETDKRNIIRNVILNNFNYEDLYDSHFTPIDSDVSQNDIRKITLSVLRSNNLYINDYALGNLILHLYIIVTRLLENNFITGNTIDQLDSFPQERKAAEDIANTLSKHYNVSFSIDEINQIAFLLINKTSHIDFDGDDRNKIINAVGDAYYSLSKKIVAYVNEKFNLCINDDLFITKLSLHFKNVLFRSKNHYIEVNPIKNHVKLAYPFIYEIAIYCAYIFRKETGIVLHEDEIAYIAMHFGSYLDQENTLTAKVKAVLLCQNYYDSSNILHRKIQLHFSDELEIISVVSNIDMIHHEYDLLITTIPYDIPNKDCVRISPFPNNSDYQNISDVLNRIKRKNNFLLKEEYFNQFFNKGLFAVNESFSSPEEAIINMSQKLIHNGYACKGFTQAVLRRESYAPTSFDIHVAIPHCFDSPTTKNIGCVSITAKPMRWGVYDVNIIILVGTSKDQEKSFQKIYNNILDILENNKIVEKLINCQSYDEFITIIANS